VLETAVAGGADYIVTGDNDLLTLGAHAGVEIVTPARFLDILEERSSIS
jgi:predicted nucleic acid-binding protein